MTEQRQRNTAFDILKGIGILLMIMGHVGFGEGFSHYIHAFHMPLFFFVSGFFFKPKKYGNFMKFLLHSAKTLLIPYSVFVLICQPLHYIYTGEWSFSYFITSFISSNHNRIDVAGAYWFLLCLFTAKIIFYFTSRYLGKVLMPIVSAVLTVVGVFFAPKWLPLCLDSALSMQLFLCLGFVLAEYKDSALIKKTKACPAWAALILLAANGFLIFLDGTANVRTNHYGFAPLFWLNSIAAVIGFLLLSLRLDENESKLLYPLRASLTYLGRNSLTFLVLNEFAIFASAKLLSFVGLTAGGAKNTFAFILISIAVLCITLALLVLASEVINRTKLKYLLGKF